jgi:hypothetical protein
MESPTLTICPCCGAKVCIDLRVEPCAACGAFAVGAPLARPEFELPAYGLTSAVAAAGALVALVFVVATVFALFAQKPVSLSLWSVVASAETAAWRLKFVLLPLALLASYAGARALAHVSRTPERFVLARFALGGLSTSALVAVAMLALIVVTIPERLLQRDLARKAAEEADSYDAIRALLEYQQQFGTLPTGADDLKKLPDPDGTIARAARMISTGQYAPESTIASLPASKSLGRRSTNVTVRPVSLRSGSDEPQGEPLVFTNYTLHLAGRDKKFGTEDDLYIRDGMIVAAPPAASKALRAPANKRVP